MLNGDPVRLGYLGTPGSTSVAMGLYSPGTNSTYPFSSTDFLILDSICAQSYGAVFLLSAPAGYSAATFPPQSTVLLTFGFGIIGSWFDPNTQGMSGPQGIIPSVFCIDSTNSVQLNGTGHVIHSPGTSKPQWMAANT